MLRKADASFYLLEVRADVAGAPRDARYASPRIEDILAALAHELGADAEPALYMLPGRQSLSLTTVESGEEVAIIALEGFIKVSVDEGPFVSLSEARSDPEIMEDARWQDDGI